VYAPRGHLRRGLPIVADPAQLANLARQATVNAGAIEHANQQLAAGGSPAEASAFDVWTHTGNALGQQARQLATDGPSVQGAVDSLPAMGAALTSPMASTTAGSAYDGAVANMESVIGDAATLFGLNPDKPAPEGALAKVGAAFGVLTGIEQSLSAVLSAIPTPAFPAARITDLAFGLPHVHAHPPNIVPPAPPIALPSVGPVIPIPFLSGAMRTLINALPAARCGDMGIGVWCGGYFPLYEIFLGSSSVWIEGSRAARMPVDITKHCIFTSPRPQDPPMGPTVGFLTTASPNVIIGGIPMPSLLSFAMGAAIKGLFRGLGKLKAMLRAADDAVEEAAEATAKVADDVAASAGSVRFSRKGVSSKTPRPKALADVMKEIRRKGITVRADDEAQQILDESARALGRDPAHVAGAARGGNEIFVRPDHLNNPRTLREELLHCEQFRKGEIGEGTEIANEIAVREEMIRNADKWGITPEEVADMEDQIAAMEVFGKYF
jgi:uncharacterized Zn-binding protein involved in type VI secretion